VGIAIIWGSITVSGRTLLRDRVMGTIEQMEGSCAPMHLTGLSLRPKMLMTLVRIDLIKNSKS
jgi:hypothetical protein